MLVIDNVQIDFDLTSPRDVARYMEADARMEEARKKLKKLPEASSPEYMGAYVEMLNQELKIYGDFIDDVFGEGIAQKLLGDNPSLTKLYEVDAMISDALMEMAEETGKRIRKYTPNRAARRAKN